MTTIKDQCSAARALGLKHFESTTPCKRGHTTRSTSGGACMICHRVEYQRRGGISAYEVKLINEAIEDQRRLDDINAALRRDDLF